MNVAFTTLLMMTFLLTAHAEVHKLDPKLQPETQSLNPEYLVYMPRLLVAQKLPLVIYLHGAGGRGDQIRKVEGQTKALRDGLDQFGKQPCIVVAPQCLGQMKNGERGIWLPEDLNILLKHLKSNLPVDLKRIYLTGNSMGGYGSWAWGGHHPEHFAAIAPIVGGIGRGGPKDVTPKIEKWAARLATVPVWAFAGRQDKVVPAEHTERMVKAIKQAGGKQVKLTVYPDQGHNARQVVFASKEYYDWMFTQKRD